MKRNRFRMFAVATTSASAFGIHAAQAQSSVSLYGNVSAGLDYVSNVAGHSRYAMDDGNYIPNLFGFTGNEDLGGGLAAVFKLEANFFLGTGRLYVPNQIFTRQAYVGLHSDRLGQVTLGHQSTIEFDLMGPLSNGYSVSSFYAYHPGNFDELANTFEFDNAVKYLSPTIGGLTFGATFGFGGQAGDFSRGRNYGLGALYVYGPLTLGATYESENDRALELVSYIGLSNFMGVPLTDSTAITADNLKNFAAGASYKFGNVLLRGLYTQSRVTYGGSTSDVNNYDVGFNWQMTPFNAINGGIGLSRFASGRWITPVLADIYSLSKRTSLYATVVYQIASGRGAVAAMPGAGQASGQRQTSVSLGIQHWF